MSRYLMKCGHASNANRVMSDGSRVPACAICGCTDIEKEITNPTEGLEGRKAVCVHHKNGESEPIPSRWNLPFFEYRPERDTDGYYCGCWGWE